MFIASKLLAFLTQPLAWVMFLLSLGLVLLKLRPLSAKALLWSALLLLGLQGWLPWPESLIRDLEARHPATLAASDLAPFAGLVVLGGALEPAYLWNGHSQPALNEGAERMTAVLPLLEQYPQFQLLFTGGEGDLLAQGMSEAERAKVFFNSMGVAQQRVLYESESRNTYENAKFTAVLPGVNPTRPWLLVTSAWHMPRALATFQKTGWNVTPWPVDYRSGNETPWYQYSLLKGARAWELVLHEYSGQLSYQFLGYL
jgi:uncharacterized SAM-binding protein YcdF (DUF218 family)